MRPGTVLGRASLRRHPRAALIAALLYVASVALLDAVGAAPPVATALLVGGPLIAALGARPGLTMVAAVAASAVATWRWVPARAPATPEDEVLMVAVLVVSAMSVLLTTLFQHAAQAAALREQLAAVREREEIAADLHDSVIQRIFATTLGLQTTERIAAGDRVLSARLDEAILDLDSIMDELRTVIAPPGARTGPPPDLRAAVSAITEEARNKLGLEPVLQLTGRLDSVPEDAGSALLKTLREALSNVARHAETNAVEVHVSGGESLRLVVADHGQGFERPRRGGHGLANMDARARALGGTSGISSSPAHGTTITWQVPVRSS